MKRAILNHKGLRRVVASSALPLACFAMPASAGSIAPPVVPAQSAGLITLLLPSFASTLVTESCPARPFDPNAGLASQATGATKASAVLGGAASALETMRAQQAGADTFGPLIPNSAPPALAVTDVRPLAPALAAVAPSIGCAPTAGIGPSAALVATRVSAPGEFLASRKVAIGKTNFDASWDRVSQEKPRFGGEARAILAGNDALESRLEAVNRWVNHTIAYADDLALFKKADYWAGPRRTLKLGKGDCEDIALLKMHMLLAAGVDPEDMYLTITRDLVRRADHAVLIVRTADGFRMLDNATDTVLDATQAYDYQPVLSFNGRRSFLHGY
ncbi:transglutaminase-like cysteine peptidase [Erythrobacter mangrovi]|uniref:Transglutaminase-like cysteine peptidase n=1 Tax=Erythrobacter mangrovi TaxID=2739433 RepID=A0A7D3XRY2_9SPHN|nr:transglutaminase-like cysteine peptidase [Erythrobacter mangrovi]QKG72234.1 transglutaminase-like cysteine peptidase [Erythrobacter mangrovi]